MKPSPAAFFTPAPAPAPEGLPSPAITPRRQAWLLAALFLLLGLTPVSPAQENPPAPATPPSEAPVPSISSLPDDAPPPVYVPPGLAAKADADAGAAADAVAADAVEVGTLWPIPGLTLPDVERKAAEHGFGPFTPYQALYGRLGWRCAKNPGGVAHVLEVEGPSTTKIDRVRLQIDLKGAKPRWSDLRVVAELPFKGRDDERVPAIVKAMLERHSGIGTGRHSYGENTFSLQTRPTTVMKFFMRKLD